MHKMKRLEVIIERMAQTRVFNVLERSGVTGYTVISALAGYGQGKRWQRDADLSMARDMLVVIAIGDRDKIETALKDLHAVLDQHIGVLSVSDVEVLRPERF